MLFADVICRCCLHYRNYFLMFLLMNLDPCALTAARHVCALLGRNDSSYKEEGHLRLRCMGTSTLITAVAMFLGFRVIMEAEYDFSLHYTDTTILYNESISRLRTYLH